MKLLKNKKVLTAIAGTLIALATLLTTIGDAEAAFDIVCGETTSVTTSTEVLFQNFTVGAISAGVYDGYRLYTSNGIDRQVPAWVIIAVGSNLNVGDSINTKIRLYNGLVGKYLTGGCEYIQYPGYSIRTVKMETTSSFVNAVTGTASESTVWMVFSIDKNLFPTLTSASIFMGSNKVCLLD